MAHRLFTCLAAVIVILAALGASPLTYAAGPQAPGAQVQIVAQEMCCSGCARKVAAQLYAARGVKAVDVDLQNRIVTVSLPQPTAATLGNLWHAVEQGEGGPVKLVTSQATYTLVRPESGNEVSPQIESESEPIYVVVDNLHCTGCAKKIAAQLYALKGVTKVGAILQNDTLIVHARPGTTISPWQTIDAVGRANERAVAVTDRHGTVSIEWATKRAPKTH